MIYKLRYDRTKYLVFNIPPDELVEKFGGDYYFVLEEPEWSGFWKTLNVEFFDESDSKTVLSPPDITCWFIEQLVINEKAFKCLSDPLEEYGKFLPISCEGIPYWVFHVTCKTGLDKIDESTSKRVAEDSGYIDMRSLVFREDKLMNLLVFEQNMTITGTCTILKSSKPC